MDLLTANDSQGRYPNSYYAAITPQLPSNPPATGALRCDVCVVGAGFTGLSAALHLAQRGFDVILLDAQRIAFGASGRNGGQVGKGQRVEQEELEDMVGLERAKELFQIGDEALDLVRSLCLEPAMGTEFHPGLLYTDHKEEWVKDSFDYAEKLRRDYDYHHTVGLDRAEVMDMVKSKAYYGGTFDTKAGHINPLSFAFGLARKALAAGVRIFENSRVEQVMRGSPATVTTDKAQISADYVIMACNGYLGHVDRHIAKRVMPINNFIVTSEKLTNKQRDSFLTKDIAVADSKFVVNYFRITEDNRLLFGGTESYGYKFPTNIAERVQKPLLEIFPQAQDLRFSHAWGGTLGITMNRLPYFERHRGNILSLSGYSGHGISLATYGGKLVAEALAGQAEKFDVMASVPTRKFPGGRLLRSPLLALGMLYYSLRDRL